MILTAEVVVLITFISFLVLSFIFTSFYTVEVKFKTTKDLRPPKKRHHNLKSLFNITEE